MFGYFKYHDVRPSKFGVVGWPSARRGGHDPAQVGRHCGDILLPGAGREFDGFDTFVASVFAVLCFGSYTVPRIVTHYQPPVAALGTQSVQVPSETLITTIKCSGSLSYSALFDRYGRSSKR